jgi:hypothetical protein
MVNIRNKEYSLEDDNGVRIEEEELKNHITKYYKGRFGKHEQNTIEMEE